MKTVQGIRRSRPFGVSLGWKGVLAAMALAGGVAACSQVPVTYRPTASSLFTIDAAWNAGFSGKTALVDWINVPSTTTAGALTSAMTVPQDAAPVAGFTPDVKKATDPRYRLVMVFGAPEGFDGSDACALSQGDKHLVAPVGAQQTRDVQAALCFKTQRVSAVRLYGKDGVQLGRGNAAEDRSTLRSIMSSLYRPQTLSAQGGDSCSGPRC